MYIKRECLEDVGYFDLVTFGKDYGEEVDFCLRASEKGWKHVLACDVVVYHVGEVSFGSKSSSRLSGERAIEDIYPHYLNNVARFVQSNVTLKYLMAATREMFRLGPRPSVLFLSHSLGGGTAKFISQVIDAQSGHLHAAVLSATPGGFELSFPSVPDHPTIQIDGRYFKDLAPFLRSFGFAKISVQHTIGWRDKGLVDFLNDLQAPYEVFLHDYYLACPSINLIARQGDAFWLESSEDIYDGCVGFTSPDVSTIDTWRRISRKLLRGADRVVTPSNDTAARFNRYFEDISITAIPHEKTNADVPIVRREPNVQKGRVRVGLLGHIAHQKGGEVLRNVALASRFLDIDFVLIGSYHGDAAWALDCNICIHGQYQEEDLQDLTSGYNIDVLWLPAIGPETYSYVLSQAINSGLPIVSTKLGAFVERLQNLENATLLPLGASSETWIATLIEAASMPSFVTIGETPRISTGYGAKAAFHQWLKSPAEPDKSDARKNSATVAGRPSVAVIPERNLDGFYSPCGFIRLILPLMQLHKAGLIEAFIIRDNELADVEPDVIVTQRNAVSTDEGLEALLRYKDRFNIPIIFDLDDNLITPIATHDEATHLNRNVERISKLASSAMQITVSTEPLKSLMSTSFQADTKVISNALAPQFCVSNAPFVDVEGPVRILYMGTMTHTADLQMILPDLERLHRKYGPSVQIGIVGVTAEAGFPDYIQRVEIPPHVAGSYLRFMSWVRGLDRWHIGLGPLVETTFNASKSAIKIADYISMGALPVVSDYAEYATYDGDYVVKVGHTPGAWFDALSELVDNPEHLKRKLEAGREHMASWSGHDSEDSAWYAAIQDVVNGRQAKD
ncbi:MAG: hypothetical protein AAF641_00395 [Pseudomonadota bacterium]